MRTRPKSVFARFTDRARRVVVLAQHEARSLGHSSVGTEHLLLSLLAEDDGIPAQVLARRGVPDALVRERVVAWLTGRHEDGGTARTA
jgi:ATP-dependent Clp protease ATP-binding subunit ClpC